ncbi:MAG: hypothetical protein LC781_18995, partial [Actinobacteria bacterium]|nr:hypothetical protein [Actinomycetota bacterium]
APAIAQNESTNLDPPPGGAPGDGPEAPPPEAIPPEASLPNVPLKVEEPAPGPGNDISDNTNTGPSDEPTSTDTGDEGTSPGPVTSTDTDSGVGDGPGGSTRNNIVEDLDEDADDEITKDEIVDDDEVDAEAREDRIAERILADLKDGKKDEDDDDDANKDEVKQSQDQDADSGDVDQDADVINTGDNVNQCVGILQVANTGNAQNATGITQFDSETDEIELEDGSQITLTPQLVVDCRQIILQIVRGERPNESKISNARLREAIQPRSGAAQAARTGAGVLVPSRRSGITATPKVLSASSAGQPKAASLRSLPRTGGSYATLLGLGTGTLLVGGGLLARRLAR